MLYEVTPPCHMGSSENPNGSGFCWPPVASTLACPTQLGILFVPHCVLFADKLSALTAEGMKVGVPAALGGDVSIGAGGEEMGLVLHAFWPGTCSINDVACSGQAAPAGPACGPVT